MTKSKTTDRRDRRIKRLMWSRRRIALASIGLVVVAGAAWAQLRTLDAVHAAEDDLQVCVAQRLQAAEDLDGMEATAASLAATVQFAQDSLHESRRALGGAQEALTAVTGQLEGLRANLEGAHEATLALAADLEEKETAIRQRDEQITKLENRPPEIVTVVEERIVQLPAETIAIRADSWKPTTRGWLEIVGAFALGIITRSLFDSDDQVSIGDQDRDNNDEDHDH